METLFSKFHTQNKTNCYKPGILKKLGIYGFDDSEEIILAALVTEKPIILIGSTGTGKTYLLNRLAKALGLKHRHYNASLISFDDIVGFPYPDKNKKTIQYLKTEANIWDAESVFLDEISRCKPENQNKLFSILYEKKLLGIEIKNLIYRWAAMNPCLNHNSSEIDESADYYLGSQPLDQALADRFAFFVESKSWDELDDESKIKIAYPDENADYHSIGKELRKIINSGKANLNLVLKKYGYKLSRYSYHISNILSNSGIRISPRRTRQFTENIAAVSAVTGKMNSELFLKTIKSSLPHKCWGAYPDKLKIEFAHEEAFMIIDKGIEDWYLKFKYSKSLTKKLEIFLANCKDKDTGGKVICTLLNKLPEYEAAAFAFAIFPAAALGKLPINDEGVNQLGKIAIKVCSLKDLKNSVDEDELDSVSNDRRIQKIIDHLNTIDDYNRKVRSQQFLSYALSINLEIEQAISLLNEIEECIKILKEVL